MDAASLFKVLSGEKSQVLKNLKKEMKSAANNQNFESAQKIRDRIFSLEKVLQNARIFSQPKTTPVNKWLQTQEALGKIVGITAISRIEAYDISNIQGQLATGSMVVFIDGLPEKSQYRKFKIKIAGQPNDFAMLKEVLSRRFGHPEWGQPDLILIDGGKGQLNSAVGVRNLSFPQSRRTRDYQGKAQGKFKFLTPIISIAKRNNELYIEGRKKPILLKTLPQEIFNLILYLRDEAHRFAITYHKKLREVDAFN